MHIHCITDSGKYITSACVENTKVYESCWIRLIFDLEKLLKLIIIYEKFYSLSRSEIMTRKLRGENDKKIVGNFHYRVREWILTEWKVPHSCNRLDGYAFCGLHIVERTGVHALCIFWSRSIFRGFEVSGKARSYTTYRAKTYCNRDRFVAIKHGMQTPYANIVSCNHEIVSL